MSGFNIGESATAVGYVRLQKHNADGCLIYDKTFKNQLTNYARSASAKMWIGTQVLTPSHIQVGVGSPTLPYTSVDPTDTTLWTPLAETLRLCDFAAVWLTYNTQYSVTYQQAEANVAWTELGLLDAAGNLWSHVAVVDFTKDPGETVTVQWQVQHIGN